MADALKTPDFQHSTHAETEVKADFAKLREDFELLKNDLARLASEHASDAKAAMKSGLETGEERAREAVDSAVTEMQEIQHQAEKAIRKKPVTAVAAALAIGYFVGGLARR